MYPEDSPVLDIVGGVWLLTARLAGELVGQAQELASAIVAPAKNVTWVLLENGDRWVRVVRSLVDGVLRAVIREVVASALRELDLTAIVRENLDIDLVAGDLDLNRLAATLDVETVVASIDLDAIVDRLDLDAIADRINLDRQVDRLDITALAHRVDLDSVAGGLDLNLLAGRIDLDPLVANVNVDAVISRVDLLTLARYVVDGIDLPAIIRQSTGTLSSEAVQGVRAQSRNADDAVAGFVSRLFRSGGEPKPGGSA